MRIGISLTVACVSAVALAADPPPPTGETVVSPGATLEKLFTRTAKIQGGLTEGPACAPDGSIYFSDIPVGADKGMILRFDPKTRETTVFVDDSRKSNGLKFDAKGRLIACEGADGGGRCVAAYDIDTKKRTVLADRYMGKRFNACNDLAIDRQGRIYFSDPKYLGAEERELEVMAVYRVDGAGTVVEITREVEKPNGVALSPDNRVLYVVDHNNRNERLDQSGNPAKAGAMKLYAFPLDKEGRVNGPRKIMYDLGEENGFDGLTVDERGNLYLAQRSLKRPGVLVLDPQGKEMAFIPTGPSQPGATEPVGIPSNCCFGAGDEKSMLYVTVDLSLYRIRLNIPGAKHAWEK